MGNYQIEFDFYEELNKIISNDKNDDENKCLITYESIM